MDKKLKSGKLSIGDNFSGFLTIGDVHGDIDSFLKAVTYAQDNNLFLISLGDIVDYGDNSVDVYEVLANLVRKDQAEMILGNHELKNWKYFTQKKTGNITTQMQDKHWVSVNGFEERDLVDDFLNFLDQRQHILYTEYDGSKYAFVHAAMNRHWWNLSYHYGQDHYKKVERSILAQAFYGEIHREIPKLNDGMPNRIYNWTNHIPNDWTVMVGHAPQDEVTLIQENDAGEMYFVDTGCSKGGFLSGIEVNSQIGLLRVHKFAN